MCTLVCAMWKTLMLTTGKAKTKIGFSNTLKPGFFNGNLRCHSKFPKKAGVRPTEEKTTMFYVDGNICYLSIKGMCPPNRVKYLLAMS